jgi:outer membrane protein
MVEEYQAKAQQYEQKQSSWTPAIAQSKANELQQIMGRIQEFEQAIQQDLQVLQNSLQAPIYEKAQKAVETLAKAKGVACVYEKSSLLYIDPALMIDLTPEARTAVNIPEGRTLESLQAELQAKAQAAQMQ